VTQPPASLADAREQFLALVAGVRPELHRYCARLVGSVIEGEDIVQEALAKAFYALSLATEVPPLRPWLFRIAHNTGLDYLKSHGYALTELRADMEEADIGGADLGAAGPEARLPEVRAALGRFLALPLAQRSAVILKDVLGHSLEEAAETMGTTVMAVKAALVRGRRHLANAERDEIPVEAAERAVLDRYASLFNARDWDGLRALISDDCRLDLVSKAERRGQQVGAYFARYEKEPVAMRVGRLEGRLALGVYAAGAAAPAYFILLASTDGRVAHIRDFRYVPYIAAEADFAPL
jgi:RNA polymerase sigma-70 factor (ECF subfamily)